MTIGKEVTLNAYGNRTIKRVLVAVEKGVLYVCKTEEFEAAAREDREPICIGFRLEDLVEAVN